MNRKIIVNILGILLMLEALFMMPAALVSLYKHEHGVFTAFIISMGLSLVAGFTMWWMTKDRKNKFYSREGFVIVGLGWILASMVGALPFAITGQIPHYLDALFEVISGFTTTGASILTEVESMSKGLLFWRSFTHWLGGMGMLVFLLAVVPMGKGGGYSTYLLQAESPGPSVGKLVPKMRRTAMILYTIYIVLTLLDAVLLIAGGMTLFEGLCTAFGTAGTGGFGVKNTSIAGFSPYIQTVTTVFMLLFGVNFSLYFLLVAGRVKEAIRSQELHTYLLMFVASVVMITVNILPTYGMHVMSSLHDAAFAVSTVMTTTGYSTADFASWPEFSRSILLVLMVVGSMAGSTGGGIKVIRFLIIMKVMNARLKHAIHPHSISLARVDDRTITGTTVQWIYFFMSAYAVIVVFSFIFISLDNFSMETNISAVLACLNNIGPGFGVVGPTGNYAAFSYPSKVVLMLDMLIGRLEIFPILLLLYPGTWKKAG